MKSAIYCSIGMIMLFGSIFVAPLYFPYNLPFTLVGGFMAGYHFSDAIRSIK